MLFYGKKNDVLKIKIFKYQLDSIIRMFKNNNVLGFEP